jgi:hypothetical protein
LARAFGLAFDPTGNLMIGSLSSNAVLRYSSGPLVTLSQASVTTVSVRYVTEVGTASSNSDFTSQAGTINLAPGQTTRRVPLATRDDLANEENETLHLVLSSPTGGAAIADGDALVTFVADDAARQITINDSAAIEGDNRAHFRGPFLVGNYVVGRASRDTGRSFGKRVRRDDRCRVGARATPARDGAGRCLARGNAAHGAREKPASFNTHTA